MSPSANLLRRSTAGQTQSDHNLIYAPVPIITHKLVVELCCIVVDQDSVVQCIREDECPCFIFSRETPVNIELISPPLGEVGAGWTDVMRRIILVGCPRLTDCDIVNADTTSEVNRLIESTSR